MYKKTLENINTSALCTAIVGWVGFSLLEVLFCLYFLIPSIELSTTKKQLYFREKKKTLKFQLVLILLIFFPMIFNESTHFVTYAFSKMNTFSFVL